MLLVLSLKTYLRFLSVLRPWKYPLASDTNCRFAMIVISSTFCEETRYLNKTLKRFLRKIERGAVSLFTWQPKHLKNEWHPALHKYDSSYHLHICGDYFAYFLRRNSILNWRSYMGDRFPRKIMKTSFEAVYAVTQTFEEKWRSSGSVAFSENVNSNCGRIPRIKQTWACLEELLSFCPDSEK